MHKAWKARSMTYTILFYVVVIAVAGFVSGCASIFLRQSSMVYFPHSDIAVTPDKYGMKYEDLTLTPAPGATINAWFVPCDSARATVIFCHGNGENIGDDMDYIDFYIGLKANVLIFDYRGYGRSSGKPSEQATYEDIMACWKYLTETRGIPASEIVLIGRSLGGGVASWLASKVEPRGLVLESTFTSVPDRGAELFPFLPVRLLARIHYDTRARLPEIKCPILILHGRQDEVIPYAHGERLFQAANEPKHFVEIRGTHNDGPYEKGDAYRAALDGFLSGG